MGVGRDSAPPLLTNCFVASIGKPERFRVPSDLESFDVGTVVRDGVNQGVNVNFLMNLLATSFGHANH